jgi:hypothetical protein
MVQRPLECPLCTTVPEEEHHLFFDCDYSKEAWNVMGIGQLLLQQHNIDSNIKEKILHTCSNVSPLLADRAAVLI